MKKVLFSVGIVLCAFMGRGDIAELFVAAERGDIDAQYNLGLMYENGNGVAKDEAKAIKWYRKAAEQGLVIVKQNSSQMDVICEKKKRVAKEAVELFRNAVTSYMIGQRKMTPPNDLKVLIDGSASKGPYIEGGEKALIDPWNNEYRIEVQGKRFAIISNGPDGQPGTSDDIRK